MQKYINDLEKLMHIHSPAQVAVWLGLKDPRPIHQWIIRKKIPRTQLAKVSFIIDQRKAVNNGIIRRSKGKKAGAV